jgi:hypothetical protein
LAARSEPIVPPARGLFSTTTWVPSVAESFGTRMREIVSAVPPGGKVAISLIGPVVGQSWLALAAVPANAPPSVATEAARAVRRVNIMRRSC